MDEKGQKVAGGSAQCQPRPLILRLPLEELIVPVLDGALAVPPASTVIELPDVCGIAILSVACAGEPATGWTLTLTTEPGEAVTVVLGVDLLPFDLGGTAKRSLAWTLLPGAGGPRVIKRGDRTAPG